MLSLFTKETFSFFNSLTGYIVIILFLLINSLFMWVFSGNMNLLEGGHATMDTLFLIAPWVFLMLIPAITMRSFADEKRNGTLDLLLTRPLSEMQIILAKYAAALVLVLLALLPTLVFYFSIIFLGNPTGNLDKGGTWGSYLGLLFLAATYTSIGLFCSSLTDNLIIAFLLAAFLCLTICYGFEQTGTLLSNDPAGSLFVYFGMIEHYRSMSRGVIDTRDVVYFLAVICIFLILTKYRLNGNKN
jgi:ABC-2 type transport system permease protein